MKVILLFIILQIFASCGGSQTDNSLGITADLKLPDSFSYKGRNPVLGNLENIQLIQEWNQKRSSLDSNVGELIADSLTLHLEDGHEYILSKDSAAAYFKNMYEGFSQQIISMNAAIPVYYSDIGHNWVYSWVNCKTELKNGESFSIYLHEDFRIVNDKIREIYQFKREPVIK